MISILQNTVQSTVIKAIQRGSQFSPLTREYLSRVTLDLGTIRSKAFADKVNKLFTSFGQTADKFKLTIAPEMGYKGNVISETNTGVAKCYSLNTAEYGNELVVNGGFDTDSGWDKDAGWTINNGKVISDGISNNSTLKPSIANLVSGKRYITSFTITSFTSGRIRTVTTSDATQYSTDITSTGTYTRIINPLVSGSFEIKSFYFAGSIDNVSVREVLSADSAVQSTQLSQPFLGGRIAPNEKYALVNGNGQNKYMSHTPISFGAGDAWSVTTVICVDDTKNPNTIIRYATSNIIRFFNNKLQVFLGSPSIVFNKTVSEYVGKTISLILTASGTSNLSLFINGVFIETLSIISQTEFSQIMYNTSNITEVFKGSLSYHSIKAFALTPEQALQEATLLQATFPEIPSVKIGTQEWATSNCQQVCTPMGNIIAEVTDGTSWANSQVLYDNAYAATSGTEEQKTYAAVKAAAMYCTYNNDADLGVIYGKLYNGFAIDLMVMDIAYYNVANPTTPWGYNAPINIDFNTLASVGGDALKLSGTTYIDTGNTGNNSSGLSLICSGVRTNLGSFVGIKSLVRIWGKNKYSLRNGHNSDILLIDDSVDKRTGYALRLIKQ